MKFLCRLKEKMFVRPLAQVLVHGKCPFIKKISDDSVLCTGHSSGHLGYITKSTSKNLCAHRAYILVSNKHSLLLLLSSSLSWISSMSVQKLFRDFRDYENKVALQGSIPRCVIMLSGTIQVMANWISIEHQGLTVSNTIILHYHLQGLYSG